jgi:hypothetical protein
LTSIDVLLATAFEHDGCVSHRARLPETPPLTRRRFLGGAVVLVCGAPLFSCAEPAPSAPDAGPAPVPDPWEVPEAPVLGRARFATLAAMFDALIPGGVGRAGARDARAAYYLDQLLGAFREDPPKIYAGGPYSGRNGGEDGFSQFQRLTRVEEIRWRTTLEGSMGIPEREFNGPVKGLLTRYTEGLDAIEVAAKGRSFSLLPRGLRREILMSADAYFVQLAYEHAVEGTYGDPVYGGNREQKGWAAISYEGDRQPVGYTARQMSHPGEG